MVVKTYHCDACGEKCKDEDVTTIRLFPRRKYEYAIDTKGAKLCGFETMTFEETHLCQVCLRQLLTWTRVIE
jgi:hypothetical protein